MENECKNINKRFFTFHAKRRPYIILKWAQTADGKIAAPLNPPQGGTLDSSKSKMSIRNSESRIPLVGGGGGRLLISNEYSNRLVHKWRSEEAAILIGTNTALLDNPELTTRLWSGNSPVRLVLDMNLRLPASLKIFNGEVRTVVFNSVKQEEKENLLYYKLEKNKNLFTQLMAALYQLKIQSVLVEGGAKLLQSFIDDGLWDEVRTVTSLELRVTSGLAAPVFSDAIKTGEQVIATDRIEIYTPKHPLTKNQ
jgi:diaminohydroxyphosphoribosylaminopyrimidine deaminase/5-amino-6-(5-phosphoribosylamino)uracil reductase